MAKERSGLNRNYCRRHVEHFRRHGSYSKGSYTASQVGPLRRFASKWLKDHATSPEVAEATDRVRTLYWRAGRPIEAFRLAGTSPHEKSNYVWGRLGTKRTDALEALAVWLAIELLHTQDPQPERKLEFRLVQTAKILQRMAGGSHKRWEQSGAPRPVELHKYVASRGRGLRHIGAELARAAQPLKGRFSELLSNSPQPAYVICR